jgi:hypothetical protein
VKPWLGAELWRSLAGLVARQGDVAATAERELCAAEQSGGRNSGSGLRVCAGAAQRMARGALKGNRSDDHGAWVREGRLARITGEAGSAWGKRIEPLLRVIPSSGVGSRRRKALVWLAGGPAEVGRSTAQRRGTRRGWSSGREAWREEEDDLQVGQGS